MKHEPVQVHSEPRTEEPNVTASSRRPARVQRSPRKKTPDDRRMGALRRFAVAITVLNVAGHAILGFEQSWAQLVFAVLAAWGIETVLELVEAAAQGRPTPLRGGLGQVIGYLLPAHITGMAVVMLLYANDRFAPILIGITIALVSKRLVRVPVNGSRRHFLNPSNTGIAATLFLFPSVGAVPAYQFTHYLDGAWDIALPALIVVPGMLLAAQLTKRVPLILAWVGAFAFQAFLRAVWFGTPLLAGLAPMTGMAFVLYTLYMLPDPGTTPATTRGQVAFSAGVAAVYGLLIVLHVMFGLFLSLFVVCSVRGAYLAVRAAAGRPLALAPAEPVGAPALAVASGQPTRSQQ